LVADVIRGMEVNKALDQLRFIKKAAKMPVSKLVNSAVANAEHNYELDKSNLFIKEIMVNEGKTLYRWMPKAHGRATKIRKRTCHIDIILSEIVESGNKTAKKQEIAAPVKLGAEPKEEKTKDEPVEKSARKPAGTETKGKKAKGDEGSKGFIGKVFQRKSG